MATKNTASNSTTTTKSTKSSTPGQLLDVAEDDVLIDFKPNTKCITDLHLRALHSSLPVAFKVQTSSPLKFLVSPPRGIIPPASSTTLRIVLRPQQHPPSSFPRSRPDRFLILFSLSASQLDNTSNSIANSIRLKVFFGGPYLLRMAAQSGDSAAARLILRRQPHLLPLIDQSSAGPADTWAPLHVAAAAGDCAEVRRIILEIGAGEEGVVDVRDREGRTALLVAAASGAVDVLEMLVEMGADRAAVDAQGRTPLDVAREKDHKDVVEILERWEMVMTAARKGDLRRLESLLKKRVGLHGRDQYGLTALHAAAIKGHRDAIAMLVESGMDVECEDVEGHTPLHLAVEGGCVDAVELLVEMGANVNARTKRGTTSLQMAETMGYESIAQLLRTRGAEAVASSLLFGASSSSTSSISCN